MSMQTDWCASLYSLQLTNHVPPHLHLLYCQWTFLQRILGRTAQTLTLVVSELKCRGSRLDVKIPGDSVRNAEEAQHLMMLLHAVKMQQICYDTFEVTMQQILTDNNFHLHDEQTGFISTYLPPHYS